MGINGFPTPPFSNSSRGHDGRESLKPDVANPEAKETCLDLLAWVLVIG